MEAHKLPMEHTLNGDITQAAPTKVKKVPKKKLITFEPAEAKVLIIGLRHAHSFFTLLLTVALISVTYTHIQNFNIPVSPGMNQHL